MRTSEAAKILGCDPRSVRLMIESGKIKANLKPSKYEYDIPLAEVRRAKREYEKSPPTKGRPRGKKVKNGVSS